MEEEIGIIERAIWEFEESGRASKTALSRFIIGKLEESGYKLSKSERATFTDNQVVIDPEIQGALNEFSKLQGTKTPKKERF